MAETCEWCSYDDPPVAIHAEMRIGLCEYCAMSTIVLAKPVPRDTDLEGFIYFVQAGKRGPVKIGWSYNVTERVKLLQSGNPARLYLIHSFAGKLSDEKRLHERFADLRIRGEWFRPAVLERFAARPPTSTQGVEE